VAAVVIKYGLRKNQFDEVVSALFSGEAGSATEIWFWVWQ
jgi:hypothetical protein